jgi:transcriptional regulator with XRE-family HTH domain
VSAETLGQRIQRLRKARGLRVTDLASTAGVTEGAIRQLESGQTKTATLIVGLRLAKLLGVTPNYLATGSESDAGERGDLRVVVDRLNDHERRLAAAERRLLEPQETDPTSEVSLCAILRLSARRELRLGAALARARARR